MIKVGIIGGAGYTGGEAIRLLLNHSEVELKFVHSNSNAGGKLYDVHTDLIGETEICFTDSLEELNSVDCLFLCVGHGDASKFLEANRVDRKVKIIDLSQDFRLKAKSRFGDREFVYGLVEKNLSRLKGADSVANPGCFATAIQLALLPLAASGKINGEVHISATTGSTGAGQKPTKTTHFSWRANNLSIYKAFEHQHLNEIGESLVELMPSMDSALNFVPYRGDFTRGIMACVYVDSDLSADQATALYKEYYSDAAFTFVSDKNIDLKQVVNTNKCLLHVEKHNGKIMVVSIIDNLLKGASGQAVQNMNILFDLPQTMGLKLKATGF